MVPRSNKNNQTARYGQLYISASLPSIPRGTGPRWTWKLAALSGSSNDSEVTYGVRNFAYVRTIKHARVQRWPEWFTAFDYTLEYRKGSANENADVLSRFPEPATEHERSGSSSLTHVEDNATFLIRASVFSIRSSPTLVSFGVGWCPTAKVASWVGCLSPLRNFASFALTGHV